MKTCLFIVDVQDGFVSSETDHIPGRIRSLLESHTFDLVVVTRFINTHNSPYIEFLNWRRFLDDQDISLVAEIQPFLQQPNVVVVDKTGYTSITPATLNLLRQHNIRQAFVTGIDTDCCVLQTAVSLFEHSIHPIVLAHYCASNGGEEYHQAALLALSRSIGKQNILLEPRKAPVSQSF